MSIRWSALLTIGLAVSAAGTARAQDRSPPESQREDGGACTPIGMEEQYDVDQFITSISDETREATGLVGADTSDVEPLEDPEDSAICARLKRHVPKTFETEGPEPNYRAVYFKVRDRYLVMIGAVFENMDPDEFEIVHTPVIVVDEDFNVIERLI